MKINHMICPRCGHDFYVDAAYGTCDACQCMFYATSSRTANQQHLYGPGGTTITITPNPVNVQNEQAFTHGIVQRPEVKWVKFD